MRDKYNRFCFLWPIITLGLLSPGHVMAQSFTNLYSFTARSDLLSPNSDGANPYAALLLSGNTLYGTALSGGLTTNGTVFAVNVDGTGFRNLHSFGASFGARNTNSDGASPYGSLVLSGNTLYGTSHNGGNFGNGTVFAINTDGSGFTTLHHFTLTAGVYPLLNTNIDGANPFGGLVLSGNILYGTAPNGGKSGKGAVFAINTDGSGFTNLHSFTLTSNSANSDGANPQGGLILSGNSLYGTTFQGGAAGNGTVFGLNIDGTGFTNLHSFSRYSNGFRINGDGANPTAILLLSSNSLYGTASRGGGYNQGTVFKVNTDGSGFTNLHTFSGSFFFPQYADSGGGVPVGGLVLSSNTLYGTASVGGTTNSPGGYGTVFAVNTDGSGFATLYRFSLLSTNPPYGNQDGAYPYAGLTLTNTTLYGAGQNGGNGGSGAIFSLPVTLRPPPPQFPAIYASFTNATIQTANMTITPGAYFTYNTNAGGSWGISAPSFGFLGTFIVPDSGAYKITVDHQTSAAASCPGGGYSPVNIYVNGTQIASNFDPAQQNGGSLAEVTNSWVVNALAGENSIQWVAASLCTRYWIQGIQVTPTLSPVLKWGTGSSSLSLYWDTNLVGFVLESSTNLGGIWSRVSQAPAVIGGSNFITNTIFAPLQLYRLHNP